MAASEGHGIVGKYEQQQLAALTPVPPSGNGMPQVALDHAEDRLDLPVLAEVNALVVAEQPLHQSTVASDLNKLDGLTMILPEQLPEAICHLKLTDLTGIAANMERRLHAAGITTVAQLCQAAEANLAEAWGSQVLGSIWFSQLRGHDLPRRSTRRQTVGHSHVLPPEWRSEERAHAVAVRMLHKAAARMRRLGYRAGYLVLSISYLDGRRWDQRTGLGLCRDTLTMVRALGPLWSTRPVGVPLKVGIVLTHLVPEGSATLPLYDDQAHLDVLADAMDRLDQKYGQHCLFLGGMFTRQRDG
ncbi:hypothetical protein ACERK3_17300 [Phycisphaerales bacterium AB-hyl4]|uniref:DNA polymerase Y-family little finger domain-containing protein n=1 Tax=Natronomicrosphaera hydrolytica TaxID=3242702 RepID=A0ABV4U9R7_9BACT